MPFLSPTKTRISLFVLCLAAALPAFAQMPPPPEAGQGPKDGPQGGAPQGSPEGPRGGGHGFNIFFSPAGEPFRADADAPYPLKLWFDGADANHDGKLDAAEFRADAERFFKAVDVDHNEIISSPENTRYEETLAPEILNYNPRLGGPNAKKRAVKAEPGEPDGRANTYNRVIQGAAQYSLISEPQPIRACDSNLDFKVTLKEWLESNRQRFVLLDRNKDGILTPEELPATPAALAIEDMKNAKDKPGKGEKRRGLW